MIYTIVHCTCSYDVSMFFDMNNNCNLCSNLLNGTSVRHIWTYVYCGIKPVTSLLQDSINPSSCCWLYISLFVFALWKPLIRQPHDFLWSCFALSLFSSHQCVLMFIPGFFPSPFQSTLAPFRTLHNLVHTYIVTHFHTWEQLVLSRCTGTNTAKALFSMAYQLQLSEGGSAEH